MPARLDPHWQYHGLTAIVLENSRLRLTCLPEAGAKLLDFIFKPADRNFLWRNPRLEPRRPVFGQNFDDWWSGGWDEVFPTCDISTYRGETYPYLGELWSLPWAWRVERDEPAEACLYLSRTTVIAPARMEKWIRLRADEPIVRFRHRLTNVGTQPMDFVWGLHPCFHVESGYRIDAPARVGVIGHTATAPLGPVGTTYPWPAAELCEVPPASRGWCEGHYATELSEGWVALVARGGAVRGSPGQPGLVRGALRDGALGGLGRPDGSRERGGRGDCLPSRGVPRAMVLDGVRRMAGALSRGAGAVDGMAAPAGQGRPGGAPSDAAAGGVPGVRDDGGGVQRDAVGRED
jgi:hypothetical protein